MDNRRRPSVRGGVLLTLCALFLTYMAVWMVIHPEPENVAGDIVLDAALVALAVWTDRHTVRRWREIHAAARSCPLDSNYESTRDLPKSGFFGSLQKVIENAIKSPKCV